LAAEAKELGATTKFTATEAADAMGYMAMAGWDATDMLSGMDGVMQLAAASGEDLAMVSDIVTDNLTAGGLQASDTAHFADVLAATATSANTNVSIMGETFKNSASVAGALGYKIEDVALAVGLMANNGVKGSIAGTALKNTFNGLLEGVTLTGAAFGDYEYSAVKADGSMKSFGDTINELRGYFEQMTEAERVANAQNIAGAYGYNGLLGILLAADTDYNKLTESINNCSGAAERMAEIRLDNLQGDITLAQSAAEALQISVGEQFLPIMRKVYQTGGSLLNQM
ncbi:MAG: phage tail tape measure protein, partial [Firmicutes bacterium]|nr:phage tail tape measure protein [Bacillota bacterium]